MDEFFKNEWVSEGPADAMVCNCAEMMSKSRTDGPDCSTCYLLLCHWQSLTSGSFLSGRAPV